MPAWVPPPRSCGAAACLLLPSSLHTTTASHQRAGRRPCASSCPATGWRAAPCGWQCGVQQVLLHKQACSAQQLWTKPLCFRPISSHHLLSACTCCCWCCCGRWCCCGLPTLLPWRAVPLRVQLRGSPLVSIFFSAGGPVACCPGRCAFVQRLPAGHHSSSLLKPSTRTLLPIWLCGLQVWHVQSLCMACT